jgi:cellulose biosynthesis protein BcsQ
MARKIPAYANKGGTTKTFSIVHFAHAFAREGWRVLVVDMDGQQHSSRWLAPEGPGRYTLRHVAMDPQFIAQVIIPTRIKNVDLVYGDSVLPMAAEAVLKMSPDGQPGSEYRVLRKALAYVDDQYDVILMDCAPGVTLLNTNALVAADHILVPLDVSDMSFEGLESLVETLVQMASGDKLLDAIPPVSVLLTKTEPGESKGIARLRSEILDLATVDFSAFNLLKQTVRNRKQARTDLYRARVDAFDRASSNQFKYKHLKALADDYEAAAREFAILLTQSQEAGVA